MKKYLLLILLLFVLTGCSKTYNAEDYTYVKPVDPKLKADYSITDKVYTVGFDADAFFTENSELSKQTIIDNYYVEINNTPYNEFSLSQLDYDSQKSLFVQVYDKETEKIFIKYKVNYDTDNEVIAMADYENKVNQLKDKINVYQGYDEILGFVDELTDILISYDLEIKLVDQTFSEYNEDMNKNFDLYETTDFEKKLFEDNNDKAAFIIQSQVKPVEYSIIYDLKFNDYVVKSELNINIPVIIARDYYGVDGLQTQRITDTYSDDIPVTYYTESINGNNSAYLVDGDNVLSADGYLSELFDLHKEEIYKYTEGDGGTEPLDTIDSEQSICYVVNESYTSNSPETGEEYEVNVSGNAQEILISEWINTQYEDLNKYQNDAFLIYDILYNNYQITMKINQM